MSDDAVQLEDCRKSEFEGASRKPSLHFGPSLTGAPTAEEQIAQLRWDEAPSYGIDEETGMAIGRTEPPMEALDEDGVCHVAVKVSSLVKIHSYGQIVSYLP